ncbi:hypothetical protein IKF73_02920 [Candidatus Saccharibacteria bacterium]|nr:hypothetical protein [Candidatus Saccharibacteria bacterium]
MAENKYLNEEKYQKVERLMTLAAVLVLVVGLCIGGFLIYRGVAKPEAAKIEELRAELELKKAELEAKGLKYNVFTKYTDGDAYDLKIITEALDPSFGHCSFDEYKNNPITKEYCTAKNITEGSASMTSIGAGAFVCIAACMIAGAIFMSAKKRHILAFKVQQVMPVAKEGIEEMSPTIGKAAGEIAGQVAGGIAKGIKKGLKDDENNSQTK